ncbi:Na/Pi symporter [Terrilactibacillus sp. S3-3]|nr:Na/Pi symporter [Terrilactibacillus sp. S3-3]
MNGFSRLSVPLERSAFIQHILNTANDHFLYAVIFGTLFTMIIQSSSATTLIAMGFLDYGTLTLPSAVAIMLGSNIGTCSATYLAAIGSSWPSKWTAYTHILFNILGVVLFIPFIDLLVELARLLTSSSRLQLAHSSVIFNLSTALLALPFAGRFGIWVGGKPAPLL